MVAMGRPAERQGRMKPKFNFLCCIILNGCSTSSLDWIPMINLYLFLAEQTALRSKSDEFTLSRSNTFFITFMNSLQVYGRVNKRMSYFNRT